MGNVYVGSDVGAALRLKDLMGSDKVRKLLPGQHPLAEGFVALRKQLIGRQPLSVQERRCLGDLKLIADVIFRYGRYWQPYRDRFVSDLLIAAKCQALLFEIEVVCFGLERKFARLEWPIYREGERDIRTHGPDILVECKLIRSDDADRILKKIREAKRQPRPADIAFFAAVGFEKARTPEEVDDTARRMNQKRRWFESHPEVTGVLIFSRAPTPLSRPIVSPAGLPGLQFHLGAVTEVINWKARNPLPVGFSFEW